MHYSGTSVSYNPSILRIRSEKDGLPHLLGSRCRACGTLSFPPQHFCSQCLESDTESIELSNEGKIYSFTVVERESLAPADFEIPFAYGYIDLPERIRVLAKIVVCDPRSLAIDMPVTLTLEKKRTDQNGNDVMVFRFTPAGENRKQRGGGGNA